MFLGLCLFVNANRIATGTGATCPLAFSFPFLLFAFSPFRFVSRRRSRFSPTKLYSSFHSTFLLTSVLLSRPEKNERNSRFKIRAPVATFITRFIVLKKNPSQPRGYRALWVFLETIEWILLGLCMRVCTCIRVTSECV